MEKLKGLKPESVFRFFEKICNIPHGSGNMEKIAEYCVKFADERGLKSIRDEANNVVIYKKGTQGFENCEQVILQGHIDMVCQKTLDSSIDFTKDAIDIYIDGDFIKANGTSLGADNGIGAAMIMAILDDNEISHPPIEAVFTTDEEIGMIGAGKLDCTKLSGRKMINLDSGTSKLLTVSCAGGSDCEIFIPIKRVKVCGNKVVLTIKGLKGGHSGTKINEGRVNANILAGRILNYAKKLCDYDIVSINGGDKGNAITAVCTAELVVSETEEFVSKIENYVALVKEELSEREEGLDISLKVRDDGNFDAIDKASKDKLVYMLTTTPNGVIEMSASIEGLVETSLNLGVLKTEDDKILLHYVLRSNKQSAIEYLEERLVSFASYNECNAEVSGHYPPWEFKKDSPLQEIYIQAYEKQFGTKPTVCVIHAGLECGIFASKIEDFDCISVGPDMYELHSFNERLSISSTETMYKLLIDVLSKIR